MKHFIAILIFLFSISNLNAQTKRIYASFGHCKSRDYEKYHFKYDTMSLTDFKKVKKLILNGFENDSNCKLSKAVITYLPVRGEYIEFSLNNENLLSYVAYQELIKSFRVKDRVYIENIEFICDKKLLKIEGFLNILIQN